jgi:hypothetical protein
LLEAAKDDHQRWHLQLNAKMHGPPPPITTDGCCKPNNSKLRKLASVLADQSGVCA